MIIRGQHFDSALISEDGSEIDSNQVEIVDSGRIIEVAEVYEDDGDEYDEEANYYNRSNEP